MELHKAIDRVAKLAARGKNSPHLYQTVRLIPAEVNLPDRVFATDGLVCSTIPVDQPVPDALLPVDVMRKVAKHEMSSVEMGDDGEVRFKLVAGGHYRVKALDQRGYPFPPAVPHGLIKLDYWQHIQRVIHAAADEKGKSGFQGVRFGPSWVGATDQVRVAVVDVPGWGEQRLVPSGLFRAWPAGQVEAAITHTHAHFRIGEETRSAPVHGSSGYPDLKGYTDSEPGLGEAMVLATKSFLECAKRATQVSPTKTVVLELRAPELRLKSWSTVEGGKGYSATLVGPGKSASENPITVVVNGKMLTDSLSQCLTPRVRVCYVAAHKPVRIESGPLVELIHPWRV